jgi:preprotein translocase subunit SecG
MKQYLLLILLISCSFGSFAKKDVDAWKYENNLIRQYEVFKENLNYWSGSYFLKETQLEEFYKSIKDSIEILKVAASAKDDEIATLQNEISSSEKQLNKSKADLEASLKNQNSLTVFGLAVSKNTYTFSVLVVVLGLLFFIGILFLMYKRSSKISGHFKKEYNELKDEFEIYKKNSLERYTSINMELHHTRLKLNKKLSYNEKN